MQSRTIHLSAVETEVFEFLLGRAPAGPREIADGIGRSDASMRSMLPRMVKEGKLSRPARGLYAEPHYGEGWIPNPLPGVLLLRHPDLSPFAYRGARADLDFLVSAMRGIAEHYADELGDERTALLMRRADEVEAATSDLHHKGAPEPD